MAAEQRSDLLGCGHVGQFAGVCQYQGCAKRLCGDCVASCEACGGTLCPAHQIRLDGRRRVFCPDDGPKHVGKKLVVRLLRGGR